MPLHRRALLGMSLFGTATLLAGPASAQGARGAALGGLGLDATQLGLRPGADEDQSKRLQEALVRAARSSAPLLLPPGRYRVSGVTMTEGMQLVGVPGATVLVPTGARPILNGRRIKRAAIRGIVFDGAGIRSSERTGLVQAEDVADLTIEDCDLRQAGANGVTLLRTGGRIAGSRFAIMRDTGLFSLDSRGLAVEANSFEDCGNNGVQLWRSQAGDDASLVRGNRFIRIRNDAGGDGPHGNGVVLFRAGGAIVEGNVFRDCALTFVRNNSGSAVQIIGNNGRRAGEVAYYSEFAFEGAILSNNLAEDVAQGFNITNLDHGGRLAVCSGNIVRRANAGLAPKGKEIIGGLGIHCEAEAAITGNVVEEVSGIAISLGWSWGMRNLVATGNMVRQARIGIGVSLVPKERNVVVANNVIAGTREGAVVGTEYGKVVTGDLTRGPDSRAAGVRVEGNAVG